MMPTVAFDAELPFDTPEEQDTSENVLLALLGAMAMRNLSYLKSHPDTPLLYESGVRYALPDQLTAPKLSRRDMKQIVDLLRSKNLSAETIVGVIRRVRGQEIFRDIPAIYDRGASDCNDLACVRVAELWRAGIPASPYLDKRPNDRGGMTYHAVVQWPDGSIEDPSLILGMKSLPGEREQEIRKQQDRLLALSYQPMTIGALESAVGVSLRGTN